MVKYSLDDVPYQVLVAMLLLVDGGQLDVRDKTWMWHQIPSGQLKGTYNVTMYTRRGDDVGWRPGVHGVCHVTLEQVSKERMRRQMLEE